jgi:tetratricopeptide (TPR) repeat protein
VQRKVGELFMSFGRSFSEYGHYSEAYNAFVEGERYNPSEPRFALNQARMARVGRRKVDTAALIERALAAGGEQTETWALAIETWAMGDQVDQARTLLERFERERNPDAGDYMKVGMQLLRGAVPPPAFPAFGRAAPRQKPAETPWLLLALETIEKALALKADDIGMLRNVAGMLLSGRPDLARRFAERALVQQPEDPDILIFVGLTQGLDGEVKEGKATLQRAAQIAMRTGKRALAEQAKSMRQALGTPMLPMMLAMNASGLDPEDLEDFF